MYTGKVEVGGPADVHELPRLIVSKLAVGPYNNNAYLLRCRNSGRQVLIDAAAEPERLMDLIGPSGIDMVITTHAHKDHWQGLADIVERTGAPSAAGVLDAPEIPITTTVAVEDGQRLTFGEITLEAITLTGHTAGSIALLYDDPEGSPHLFTGDCLFPGGVGNTWGDPARFESLLTGVVARIFDRLPDETWVYPGHGHDTTLGAERPNLDEWRIRGW